LVEHLEVDRNIRLEWKLMQQPCAEGVNGLNLEAARRLNRSGEQAPRQRALPRGRLESGGLRDALVESGIVERGPLRQRLEHAVCHVGGGRLGIGDAQDLGRVDALQQQVDDALREHPGFAGPRIGGHEDRSIRIGGAGLRCAQCGWNVRQRVHDCPPGISYSLSPPEAAHSLTRARWS
jgi:hypothetical protein